jgi:hypothetical protein
MKWLSHLRGWDLVISIFEQRRKSLDKADLSPSNSKTSWEEHSSLPQCARKNGVFVDLFSASAGLFPRNSNECQQCQLVEDSNTLMDI